MVGGRITVTKMRLPRFLNAFLLALHLLFNTANAGRIYSAAMVVARTKRSQKSSTSSKRTTPPSTANIRSSKKIVQPKPNIQLNQGNSLQQQQQQQDKMNKQTPATTSWRTASTIGEAVQLATTVSDLLEIASTMLWVPTDPNLPIHFKQSIHHDRRQRWSAQLLCKLGDLMIVTPTRARNDDDEDDDDQSTIWQDERLARTVLAAAYPFYVSPDDGRMESGMISQDVLASFQTDGSNKGKSVRGALVGLATLAGKVPIVSTSTDSTSIHPDIVQGIHMLLQRAEAMAGDDDEASPLHEICEMRWASGGLLVRLGPSLYNTLCSHQDNNNMNDDNLNETNQISTTNELFSKLLPKMQERVKHLPFDIVPMGVTEWANAIHHHDIMDRLQREIPFLFDTITTRTGASVTERRGTAWVTEPGIGALAYSGKLMPPTSPLPPIVQSTMRLVETATDMPRNFFDCALCNHYPTRDAACQFHTDPEHGTMWERASCVVAMGDSRRFAFRPIPQLTTWQAWDIRRFVSPDTSRDGKPNQQDECTPAVIQLFAGDIVQMWGTCNDDFHHAVYPGDASNNSNDEGECFGRISLVLKRAMVHKGNRRGHGLVGEGRRSRR